MITDSVLPGTLGFGQKVSNRHYLLESVLVGWMTVGCKVMDL